MSRVPVKLTPIGNLYKQVEDFKQKLCNILHQLKHDDKVIEINKYYDKLMLMKQANIRKPIEMFYDYGIKSYKREILLREDAFFLGKLTELDSNYGNDIEKEYGVRPQDMFFLNQIKDIWPHLQPKVKINIWNYIWVICFLCEKILDRKELATEKMILKQQVLLN